MCGITGKVSLGQRLVAQGEVERMNAAIAHRGPDDHGVYLSPDARVGLGSQRLAVVDLSPRGHQPMRFHDRYVIVFNGEIYNFREERATLERAGVVFRSNTDTEVVVALYHRDGSACVDRLRGMFAFAIYDEQEQTLFCARDRIGKKPFKYAFDGNTFLFASELKALLTQPEVSRAWDPRAIHEYLLLQYVPAPRTGFRAIQKLPAAHWLRLHIPTRKLETQRYWTLSFAHQEHLPSAEWRARILATLDEAVRLRMVADVPVGAFLSGGLDSSAVVALMQRHSRVPIRTFSIGFEEPGYNELPAAKRVAEVFNTHHTEFVVRPNMVVELPALARHFEEPFGDSSALPTFLLARLARPHVTVALTGDGGDENFGGYVRYSVQHLAEVLRRFPPLQQALAWPVSERAIASLPLPLAQRAARFARSLRDDFSHGYARYIGYLTDDLAQELLTPDFAAPRTSLDPFETVARALAGSDGPTVLDRTFAADIATYLSDDLQVKMDLATMASSLEARSPLLDHQVVELCARLPADQKVRGVFSRKMIFRETLRPVLPPDILARPKHGFSVPVGRWFRGELREFLRDTLLSERSLQRGLFRRQALERFIDTHQRGTVEYGKPLWVLLLLELWFSTVVDASSNDVTDAAH